MNNTLEMFLDFYPISKQDKVKVYPRVETQVNSAHGHINVTYDTFAVSDSMI